jgi:CelD/BcsL family acetyltransferase involved in cellulose biosynthesis
LRLDGKPIAGYLTFRDEFNVYLYMPVFDSDFRTYSPGALLIADIVDFYADSGVRNLDFLRGAAAYKFDWCWASNVNYDYVTPSPASNIGRLYATIFCARKVLKAFWSTSHQLEA